MGGGTGFGERDLDWQFSTEKGAESFAKKVKAKWRKGVSVDVTGPYCSECYNLVTECDCEGEGK